MEPSFIFKYSILLLMVSVLLQASTSRCCLEHEKLALLQLKSYFMAHSSTSGNFTKYLSNELSSWDRNGEGNCCLWNRVACNKSTQHVTELSLSMVRVNHLLDFTDDGFDIDKTIVLNVSLFQPFGELIRLDLSSNNIEGVVGNGGYKRLSLRKLEILVFGENTLQHEELGDLVGSLPSLKKLFLNANAIGGNFPGQELAHLKKLEVLDLSSNSLIGSLLGQELGQLKKLRVLDLRFNMLNGSLQDQGLCNLRNLEDLRLYENELSGSIPKCLWNLTSLRVLDLSYNNFSGNLPALINLPSLQFLSIYKNTFQGRFSLCYLMNHSRIEYLLLSNNALQVEIEDSSCLSTHKLVALGLSQCNLIGQSNIFPNFLSNQSNLELLDLSSNRLTGSYPKWLLQNNSNLQDLNLRNNSITGSLDLPKHKLSLIALDVSSNKFNGKIPQHIGMALSSLNVLNMSLNSIEGHIPVSIGNMTQLLSLDLSNNNLSGELPRKLFSDCTFLQFVLLSKNNLQGEIIPYDMNLPFLEVLYLGSNNFSGVIKGSLNISTELIFFDISNNKATGEVPSWIGNLENLNSISLARNEFQGRIPSQLCKLESLEFLDLSENRFTGEIPSCGRILPLRFLHMHGNHLTGAIPKGLANLSSLVTLDLHNNHLSGDIPPWIDQLSNLVVLLLGGNRLEGKLPIQLCHLQNINIIDLSNNDILGAIPTCFRRLSFGAPKFGTSYNSPVGFEFDIPWNSFWPFAVVTTTSLGQEEVEFIVKNRYTAYKGNILAIMSLLDLSSNRLIGEIPPELGEMGMIQALNFSHNRLSGSIPRSFSELKSIESLDLSSNNLSGAIPSELVDLNFLETFNVSYNNLSGEVPETRQFGTFDESNYRGNPSLCGSRLSRSCGIDESVPATRTISNEEGDDGFDIEVFLWSFGMSSITVLLAFIAILAINPHWRRVWFAYIDMKFLWWLHP